MKQATKNKLRALLGATILTAAGIVGMAAPMADPGQPHQLGHVLEVEVAAMTNAAHRDLLFQQGYELTAPMKLEVD
jgi:hypothetical protein